ncbi:hypothetical protein [Amycolatopsis sp. cmx-4-68]|uniref:hypothetical protein n=1 Tax=Amycolatopsis sp. cmx-4-68 TaxID=2790938 RepID=UPI00397A7E34
MAADALGAVPAGPDEPDAVHEARAAAVAGSTPGTMVVATPPGDREPVVRRRPAGVTVLTVLVSL